MVITRKNKVNQILKQYPALSGCDDMVEFILDIREAFNLEKVPFQISVGNWSSGSLDNYYASVQEQRARERQKKKPKNKNRKGSPGWVRY